MTALIHAAHNGLEQVARRLIKGGVDPSLSSSEGVTALIAAASEGHTSVVEALLSEAKADPDQTDAK